jgi:hypothetical protein
LRDAIKRIGHGRTTNSHELERVGQGLFQRKWLGVVPRDKIPPRKPDSYLICNLDDSGTQTLYHWVCRYVTPQGKAIWHDPLGRDGEEQASALIQQLRNVQWTEDDPEQDSEEDNCGQRCLAALRIAKELGAKAFLSL